VPAAVIRVIREWQDRTESLVVVDGTFQYLGWAYRAEQSAQLNPDLTVRLVCPTKALSLNAFRFSYLIVPRHLYAECAVAQDLYHGTTSLTDHLFARAAIDALTVAAHAPMLKEAEFAFQQLARSPRVADVVVPTGGYFAFVRPTFDIGELAAMGPEHFDMSGFDGWVRVNLMNPQARRVFEFKPEVVGTPRPMPGPEENLPEPR
jgi:histidinol-phosphate/aromatic aminotransferase/cobyric acid decarboxylase-like protein